jgi:hypothetical protein
MEPKARFNWSRWSAIRSVQVFTPDRIEIDKHPSLTVGGGQFSSGRIPPISDRATNCLYGSPLCGASEFLGQGDSGLAAIGLDRSRAFAGHLLGCAQYSAGSKKASSRILSNRVLELQSVHVIRPQKVDEAIGSPAAPVMKRDRIKVRVKDSPRRFQQIVDYLFGSHCRPLLSNLFVRLVTVTFPYSRCGFLAPAA